MKKTILLTVLTMLLAVSADACRGRFFNLGFTPGYTLRQFVDLLAEFCRFDVQVVPFPKGHREIEIGDYYSDFSLIQKELGWSPKVGLKEGLKKTMDYYKNNSQHYWEVE